MRFIFLALVSLSLSACAASPTKVMVPLSAEKKGTLNINSVKVYYGDLSERAILDLDKQFRAEGVKQGNPNQLRYISFKEALKKITWDHLEGRDSDSSNYATVDIEIDNLKLANIGAAIFIGDMDQLSGSVRVYDSESKAVITEFYVDVVKGVGGLLGLAIRGTGPREKLALQYADYIGDQLGFE